MRNPTAVLRTAAFSVMVVAAAPCAAQESYRATFTVADRSGPECRPSDRLDGRHAFVLAPDPTSEHADGVEAYLHIDGDHLFYLRGRWGERLQLRDARLALDPATDGYVELPPDQVLREAAVVVAFDGGRCLVQTHARFEVVGVAAVAVRDVRGLASRFAVQQLVSVFSRAQELAGRFDEAIVTTNAALRLADAELPPDSQAHGAALQRLASVHWNAGRYPLAAELGERALELLQKPEDRSAIEVVAATNNLGLIYRDLGRHERAVELFRRALTQGEAEVGGDDEVTRSARHNLGLSLQELELSDQALPLLERVYLERSRTLGESNLRTLRIREALANTLARHGRVADALVFAQQTQDLYVAAHGARHPYALHHQIALCGHLSRAGEHERARTLLRATLDEVLATLGPAHRSTVLARRRLAAFYIEDRRFDLAEQQIDALLGLAEQQPDSRALLTAYALDARIALREAQARWQDALDEIDRLLQVYRLVYENLAPDLGRLQQKRGLYLLRLGRRDEAIVVLRQWVDSIERQRGRIGLSEAQRRAVLAEGHVSYRRLAYAYLQSGRVPEAFDLSEMTKARGLVDALATQSALDNAGLDDTTRSTLTGNAARIAKLDEAAAEPLLDPARRMQWELERNQLDREAQALRRSLAERLPRYRALAEVRLVDAAQAPRLLAARRAAISYMVAEERVFAFVVAPGNGVAVFDLMAADTLRDFVTAFRALAMNPAGEAEAVWRRDDGTFVAAPRAPGSGARRVTDWREVASAFGAQLLAPVRTRLRDLAQLYVVPDGPLAEIPFDALIVDGKTLAEATDVVLVQSMSILALMQAREAPPKSSLPRVLSVGDPVYTSGAQTAQADSAWSNAGGLRRTYEGMNLAWPPLPGTRREVLAIKEAFERKPGRPAQVAVMLGADASEARLQALNKVRALRGFRYLHFATHGYLSQDAPELSALVLSQEENTTGTDGFITAAEWLAYELDSELVVMSACDTGRGKALAGEGIMGLPYALFVAGNRAAVLTLWKIADDSSASFVTRLFERVAAGTAPSLALAETKREFLRRPKTAHPMHWAAFVFVGK